MRRKEGRKKNERHKEWENKEGEIERDRAKGRERESKTGRCKFRQTD